MTSPLHDIILKRIEREGPLPLSEYMSLCLGHPDYGYYMTRDPFGAAGDFTTAPEISQMFGELIGLWLIQTWHILGEISSFNLIEFGPGRGTLMSDIMRVAHSVPAFKAAAQIHFIETSPLLRAAQQRACPSATWHENINTVPVGPCLIIANEFFDALPVDQYEFCDGRWFKRCVDQLEGKLTSSLQPTAPDISWPAQTPQDGDIYEYSPASAEVLDTICKRLSASSGACLVIDYGYMEDAFGDTLQAVKHHQYQDIFETPGACDLTAHVNFSLPKRKAKETGVAIHGPITQGDFLINLGIIERASQLEKNATAKQSNDIQSALHRLTHKKEMGDLFKVMAMSSPTHHPLTGFLK